MPARRPKNVASRRARKALRRRGIGPLVKPRSRYRAVEPQLISARKLLAGKRVAARPKRKKQAR